MAEKNRDYAGYGPTDGIQSGASAKEAEKLLSGEGGEGVNVKTGWSKKTRYTGKSNEA